MKYKIKSLITSLIRRTICMEPKDPGAKNKKEERRKTNIAFEKRFLFLVEETSSKF